MREYGGYLEFEQYQGSEYHENAIALNSGRNCLRYLIKARGIKRIAIPKYICSAVTDVCDIENVIIDYYDIDQDFRPILGEISEDEYIYVVNYFGQLEKNYLKQLCDNHSHIIVDNSQDFYAEALPM